MSSADEVPFEGVSAGLGVELPPARDVPLIGRVAQFDEPRGIGVVETTDGRQYPFHCTAITDGSRSVAEATTVVLTVRAGRLGRLEASSVRPLDADPAAAGS